MTLLSIVLYAAFWILVTSKIVRTIHDRRMARDVREVQEAQIRERNNAFIRKAINWEDTVNGLPPSRGIVASPLTLEREAIEAVEVWIKPNEDFIRETDKILERAMWESTRSFREGGR